MKHVLKLMGIAACMMLTLTSCGSKTSPSQNRAPFGQVYQTPCEIYDDDNYFAATGFASGDASQKGVLQLNALKNAQDMCAMKIQHAVEGIVTTYNETIGHNNGTDIDARTQTKINNTIRGIINTTSECCLRFSEVDARGDVECYVAIKIPKKEIANAIKDNVPEGTKEDIRKRDEQIDKALKENKAN